MRQKLETWRNRGGERVATVWYLGLQSHLADRKGIAEAESEERWRWSSFWDPSFLMGDFIVYTVSVNLSGWISGWKENEMLVWLSLNLSNTLRKTRSHYNLPFPTFYIYHPTILISPAMLPSDESPNPKPKASITIIMVCSYYYHSAQKPGAVLCHGHEWYLKSCVLLRRGVLLLFEMIRFMVLIKWAKISHRFIHKRGHSHI